MKNRLILIVAFLMAVSLVYIFWHNSRAVYWDIKIGQTLIKAEAADTLGKQARGLSGRRSLAPDLGMFFYFSFPSQPSFWMKEMKFPLDMIWIRDGKVVDLTENLPPPRSGEAPATAAPREPVTAVLEVNAGFARQHNIKIGDAVEIGD